MTKRCVRVDSYFSLPTDLAEAMKAWPEFVSGEGYFVRLSSGSQLVTVKLVEAQDDDRAFVQIEGEDEGRLFHSVVGAIVCAMAAHSDDVMLTTWDDRSA